MVYLFIYSGHVHFKQENIAPILDLTFKQNSKIQSAEIPLLIMLVVFLHRWLWYNGGLEGFWKHSLYLLKLILIHQDFRQWQSKCFLSPMQYNKLLLLYFFEWLAIPAVSYRPQYDSAAQRYISPVHNGVNHDGCAAS